MKWALGLKRKWQSLLSAFPSPSVPATCHILTSLFLVWLFSAFLFLLWYSAMQCAGLHVLTMSPLVLPAIPSISASSFPSPSSRCPSDRALLLCVLRDCSEVLLVHKGWCSRSPCCQQELLSASCHSRWQPWPTGSLLGSPVPKIWQECVAAVGTPFLPAPLLQFLVNRK